MDYHQHVFPLDDIVPSHLSCEKLSESVHPDLLHVGTLLPKRGSARL